MPKNQKHSEGISTKSGRLAGPGISATGVRPKGAASGTGGVSSNKSSILNEKPGQGGKQPKTTIIADNINRPEWQMTAVEKMEMAQERVTKKTLETLKSKTNLDYDKLSAILSTTRATLINKKGEERFSTALSERIVSIADLYSYGFEVFEDASKFNQWIFTPNKALGGRQPFELLNNQFGREEVRNVIGRIDYGVYS